MIFSKNKNTYFLAVLFSVIIVTFFNLPWTFYQQDEWQSLSNYSALGAGAITYFDHPLKILLGEGRLITNAFEYIFLYGFRFNVIPIIITAILFHVINVFMTYFLVKKISNNTIVAFFASLFLALGSVSHQSVTWIAASATLMATFCILASILLYLKFIEFSKKKYLYISFLLALVSLSFKEIGVFLFILFPIMYLLFKKNTTIIQALRVNTVLFIYGGILILVRILKIFLFKRTAAGYVSEGDTFFLSLIVHLLLYPFTSLFQIFVPPLDLYALTPLVTKMQYKFLNGSPLVDLVAQSVTADMISVFGSVFLLSFLVLIMHKSKDKFIRRNILFALALFFASFLPYAVIHRESSYLSSRYFYLGAIGAGILFGYVVMFFSSFGEKFKWIVFCLAGFFLWHHASIIRGDVVYQVKLGDTRKALLFGIKDLYPKLDKKTIFYVKSDKAYYGDITNPFQNGFGYVLEVWYDDSGDIPNEFFLDRFLWDLGSEGYREKEGRGFGYFQNVDKMAKSLADNKLSSDIIHGYFFDSSTQKVIDVSESVRGQVATFSAGLNE